MKSKLLLIIFITLLFYPKVNFGQAPNLGTASGFALFTSNGAFGNVGATSVIKDIGTNAGALTGFPPGTLVGQIHVADTASAQAATDLETAYNYLSGITCDTAIGTNLGSGQVLTPKVYCLNAASILNGNLILDGQGNSNSLFIFKIDGALTTNVLSNVNLIDSACICNVYWQINGGFQLGDSSVFRGNVIANGAINLLESSSLLGRGLSRMGAISLNNNIVSADAINCDNLTSINPLPIELISFSADCNNQNILIKWSTATEVNNDYYTIERSKDGINWLLASIIVGAGNSNTMKNYSFTDSKSYSSVSYYRLKQTDFDGKFKYSDIISISNCKEAQTELNIYPNPANGTCNLFFNGDKSQIESVAIYNVTGEKVYDSESYQSVIDLSDKTEGIYFLQAQQIMWGYSSK